VSTSRCGTATLTVTSSEYLAAPRDSGEPTATLVIAPAPELGLIPWDLLTVHDDVRLPVTLRFPICSWRYRSLFAVGSCDVDSGEA
jgi:hypothetical protein